MFLPTEIFQSLLKALGVYVAHASTQGIESPVVLLLALLCLKAVEFGRRK